jgi:hypothetical protein
VKQNHKVALFVALIVSHLVFLACNSVEAQEQQYRSATSEQKAINPPEHPITEDQLRTFLMVTHFLSANRQLIHEKLEAQRKQMPEWYPDSVWNEISDAIESIDTAALSLPVYQRFLSEEDAKFMIRFMATPQGQKLVQSLVAKNVTAQHAGAAPEKAYEQALAELAQNEGAGVRRILSGMSATELQRPRVPVSSLAGDATCDATDERRSLTNPR